VPPIAEILFADLMRSGRRIQVFLKLFLNMMDGYIEVQGHTPLPAGLLAKSWIDMQGG